MPAKKESPAAKTTKTTTTTRTTGKKTTTPRKTSATKKTTTRATSTKRTPTKTSTTARKTPVAKISVATNPVTNANMIEKNKAEIGQNKIEIQNNSKMIHMLYGLIIILLFVIVGLAFYIGTIMGKSQGRHLDGMTQVAQQQDVTVTVIDDARCSDCQTDAIVSQLRSLPFLSGAEFVTKDFIDENMESYLNDNQISLLPAVIFSTNLLNDGGQITPYLSILPNDEFSLSIGAQFDPFAKRSDKGFLMLDTDQVGAILDNVTIDGDPQAPITWIEYSDLECPYCARLHNDGTPNEVKAKYPEGVNIVFKHFPLDFHPNALPGAQALECAVEQGVDKFALIDESFKKYDSGSLPLDGFYNLAIELGAEKSLLEECVASEKYRQLAQDEMLEGQTLFGITGTPGNVIINTQTGEYEVVSGAYPAATFEEIIARMLEE